MRLLALLIACFWVSATTAHAQDVYQVGIASVDVTPAYPIRLNGFGNRRKESEGISQRIFAKSLAIGQKDQPPLVLVALDSLGIRAPMVDEVARRLARSHQLPRQNFAVTFTHSHCTPKVNGACDNIFSSPIPDDHQRHIDQYTKELTDKITEAAQQALNSMEDSRLQWTVGKVRFAKNRRTVGGPVDHDLPVLVVRSVKTDKLRAIYVSYACHCVTLSFNRISGDWAGYAAEMIQRRFPGATALVSIGAGSDQNPISGVTGGQVEVATGQGMQIADEVKRLLDGPLRSVRGVPAAVRQQVPLPLNTPPTREQLVAQTKKGRPTDKYNAQTQLARLDRGETLQRKIDYTIQTWTFGDSLCMSFLAGEVCVDYSLRLKAAIDRDRYWLNTYSNDFCSYIPSERLVKEGGYGGGSETPYFALPSTLKAGLEQKIVDEVLRQVPQGFLAPKGTLGVSPKSPEDSLCAIRSLDGWSVQLVAAEPQVRDPVAIDFGPDGRLWVAEMKEYGRGVYEKFSQNSRVRWLRDSDGDGRFETAETFVDGLRFPTDVKVWRDGVLICDAPNILWARDTNDDGKADRVETLFSGFEVRNAQARVNSLRWGLDGWLYGAGGLFGGKIKSHQTGATVDCSNRDFRIQPDSGLVEAAPGRSQQGRDRNDWGDWFGCSNGTLLRTIAPSEQTPTPPLSFSSDALTLFPPDNLVRFELSGAPGRATSACGLGIYRDWRLGPEMHGDAFTCEPVHQLVHRIDLIRSGHGFTGKRGIAESTAEFLHSTDRWFRPVQARTGPDGALWVVDMYRFVIEHPRWIPQATLDQLEVHAGSDRGRIYRVVPAARQAPESSAGIPDLTKMSSTQIASQLGSPNGVIRDLAQQMLRWRHTDPAADQHAQILEEVRRVLARGEHPAAQVQALATLIDLGGMTQADLLRSFRSEQIELVVAAIELAAPEELLDGAIEKELVRLSGHSDARIRRAAIAALARSTSEEAAVALVRRMGSVEPDHVVRNAALDGVAAANVAQVLPHLLSAAKEVPDATARKVVLTAVRFGDLPTLQTAIQWLLRQSPSTDLASALDALDARAGADPIALDDAVVNSLRQATIDALEALKSDDTSDQELISALRLLGRPEGDFTKRLWNTPETRDALSSEQRAAHIAARIAPAESVAVQKLAVHATASTGSADAATHLVGALRSASPAIRQEILQTLIGRDRDTLLLLVEVREGRVRRTELDAAQRQQLLNHPNAKVKSLARQVFQSDAAPRRAEVVASFAAALASPGVASAGKIVFDKRCASCHKLGDRGHVVGPDLQALTNRDPQWLLTAILDPNREVDARYMSWIAVTEEGRSMSGLLVEESDNTIQLREPGGKQWSLPRREIERFQSTNLSLMPEGLEKDMTPADLRNVIAFLVEKTPPPKKLAGNQPRLIRPDERGVVSLSADAAEIRGKEITFEQPFANVGWWHDRGDSVTWRLELPKPDEFDVYLNVSCDGPAAGNQFQIAGMGETLRGEVTSTGGWDRYRQRKIATVQLPSGPRQVVIRSEGAIQRALFDLKEVRLVPAGTDPGFATADVSDVPLPRRPPEIAPFLLDETIPLKRREQVIHDRPGMGPAIVALLVKGLEATNLEQQYERIPWIWRVAIAVGRRNDGGEVRDLLEISVPGEGQPLLDWHAVVIGGGLINGISQLGISPGKRFNEILAGLPDVKRQWPGVLQHAVAMADDESVKAGTRYDALRMVALLPDAKATAHLQRYLAHTAERQLQMGAVSGLVDVGTPAAETLLVNAAKWLKGRNRQLAVEGLLRTQTGAEKLQQAILAGDVVLTPAELEALKEHPLKSIQRELTTTEGTENTEIKE